MAKNKNGVMSENLKYEIAANSESRTPSPKRDGARSHPAIAGEW